MPTNRYSEYIQISPSFESVVDLAADQRYRNLWREYIVGDDMEKLVEVLCQSLNYEAPDARRAFWVHGSYGTGKSYAAIFVKHLLEESPETVDSFLGQSGRLSKFRNRFMKVRNKGEYLVIWKAGCTGLQDGNAMLMEAEKCIRDALKERFGNRADYGEDSLHDAVLAQLRDKAHNWDYILETSTLGDDYENAEELLQKVEAGDLTAIQRTAAEIRRKGWGLVNGLETFKKWVTAVIENNGLSKSGIFFVWDEFTEYISHSDDHTILQQLSEFSKETPFYLLLVVHRTTELIASMGADRYQKISDRFHSVEFHITPEAAYDLIAGSILPRNGMELRWPEERNPVVSRIRPSLPDMEGADDKIAEQIDRLCPVHPMTIKLLSRVADSYAGAQRTMFRFMKDQQNPEMGFVGYINRFGPEDQACWLTPDWLWDYFFTRTSDMREEEKSLGAADYIRHYEDNVRLIENNENALRVFKTAMLLMVIMLKSKGFYGGRKAQDGISATMDCLKTCLSGVITKNQVDDLMAILEESRVLMLDKAANGVVHIQMPYAVGPNVDLKARIAENDKKYSRYQMFAKDGVVSQEFEKQAWDENDASMKRMKIAVCCAETSSIKNRLEEITRELDKFPYKLGLLVVTVRDENQALAIQSELQSKAAQSNQPRLVIALNRTPFTENDRQKWLETITRQEMAAAAGATADANAKKRDAEIIISSWVGGAVNGGRMIAWNGQTEFTGIYGMANLRKIIRTNVQETIFPYAPETVSMTATAYKPCNAKTPLAGIERKTANSQLNNILLPMERCGALEQTALEKMAALEGSKPAKSIAALARCILDATDPPGTKIGLDDIWLQLQKPPYGYYDNMVCGVLLGYVFSAFKTLGYTWTDSSQGPHIMADANINAMVLNMCKGKLTTDFLFAGTETWRAFREYLKYIFALDDTLVAEQVSGCHNVREAVTKSGAPFWAIKYLPDSEWPNPDAKQTADQIVDHIQHFIVQDSDAESAMSSVVQLFQGKAKVKSVMAKSFRDKNIMAVAFRNFLFQMSPDLRDIAEKLTIQPQLLSDKIHTVMQGAIYTWTEEQVAEKLDEIVDEYRYLYVLNGILGQVYQSADGVKRDLRNMFDHLRICMAAIAALGKEWYPALEILHRVSLSGLANKTRETAREEMSILRQYGTYGADCLKDARPVLADILAAKELEYTAEELSTVYGGLKGLSSDTSLNQFERELKIQIDKISAARNRILLKERWTTLTGTDTVKDWCAAHGLPLPLLVEQDVQRALSTLMVIQNGQSAADASVKYALSMLSSKEMAAMLDDKALDILFLNIIGEEYREFWGAFKDAAIREARLKHGSDMSAWPAGSLVTLRSFLKQKMQEKARQEKLAAAKAKVVSMPEKTLRDKMLAFLEEHPEYCDRFSS